MSSFLGIAIFLLIVAGLVLHAGTDLPWYIGWVGQLPGDLIIRKKSLTLYLPITSCLILSAALSLFLSLFSKK